MESFALPTLALLAICSGVVLTSQTQSSLGGPCCQAKRSWKFLRHEMKNPSTISNFPFFMRNCRTYQLRARSCRLDFSTSLAVPDRLRWIALEWFFGFEWRSAKA